MAKKENEAVVEREIFEKDGKQYFSYHVKGKLRGKDVKISVIPPDRGGYAVLDIVFGNDTKANVVLKPYEIKDEATGNVIKGNTYAAQNIDEDGEVYECKIEPFRASDKALLKMLVK